MNKIGFLYSEGFKGLDFGYGHPMRGDRYEKALEEFKKMGLLNALDIKKPELVTEDTVNLFHTPEYTKRVQDVSKAGRGSFGQEVPSVKGIYDIILLSVSASIAAADYIMDESLPDIAVNICGGWHHAFENMGRGFCVFNDIAIAANYLLKQKNVSKIMIIDYDAHHGDGTQRAFYESRDVYTMSFHQDPAMFYPFRSGYENELGSGQARGFNRNFPLPALCTDAEFISNFEQVPDIIGDFKPEVLIVQMGVDGSKECTISNMRLSRDVYDYASGLLAGLQKKYGFKLLGLGGGGFVHPMLGQNWGIQIKNFAEM